MATGIRLLTEEQAVSRIVDSIENAPPGEARFALVLGAGFSQGLVPTTRELISEDLPLWMKALKDKTRRFDELKKLRRLEKNAIARDFWKGFVEKNHSDKYSLAIDEKTGLPTTFSEAYMAVFDPEILGALGDAGEARSFQRALMKLERNRLNAAHFLLGSILGVQPGTNRADDHFAAAAAFSRLVVTTNFDPFLQIALQAVNQLYFMSDTPKLGVGSEIFDASTDAIHLVYLHGSVHRRVQAASNSEIEEIKKENAKQLARVFERMGVIVIGYHGWDDAIVNALEECDGFAYGLYWCGRADDPTAPGVVGAKVPDILKKRSASYVRIGSAGSFVARFFNKVVKGLPRLIENPIGQVREFLEGIDLSDVGNFTVASKRSEPDALSFGCDDPNEAFIGAKESAIETLIEVEPKFTIVRNHRQSLALAKLKNSLKDYVGTLAVIERVDYLDSGSKCCCEIRIEQAYALIMLDRFEEAIEPCSLVIDSLGKHSPEILLKALFRRGYAYAKLDQGAEALSDYGTLIGLEGAPAEQVGKALLNRAVLLGESGDSAGALSDYGALIGLEGAPAEQVGKALGNLGWLYYEMREPVKSLESTKKALYLIELDYVRFNLGLILLANSRDGEAMEAYRLASERYPERIEELGMVDLREAMEDWLSEERAAPIIEMLEALKGEKGVSP